eukprot:2825904-Prorocentrum_lima.AAC.1
MTSSLVGSEMCIRDRYKGVTNTKLQREQEAPQKMSFSVCVPVCVSAPVSYTHLTLPTICSV